MLSVDSKHCKKCLVLFSYTHCVYRSPISKISFIIVPMRWCSKRPKVLIGKDNAYKTTATKIYFMKDQDKWNWKRMTDNEPKRTAVVLSNRHIRHFKRGEIRKSFFWLASLLLSLTIKKNLSRIVKNCV